MLKIFASQFGNGPRYRALYFPAAYYGWPHFDEVHTPGGELVGLSCHCSYSNDEGEMLSLAMINKTYAKPGTKKLPIPRHAQKARSRGRWNSDDHRDALTLSLEPQAAVVLRSNRCSVRATNLGTAQRRRH